MKKNYFLVLFGLITVLISIKVSNIEDFKISSLINRASNLSILSILVSIFFYNLSIFLRALRINYFVRDKSNFCKIIYLQYLTTGIQLSVPFRLGDGIRIYLFRKKLGNITNSALIFITEKLFDLATLILLLFLTNLKFKYFSFQYFLNLKIVLVFVLLSSIIIILFNFTINKINQFSIIKKILNKNNLINKLILELRNNYRKFSISKFTFTFFLSLLIWVFDSLSFQFIIYYFQQNLLYNFVLGPLTALSSILPSPPLGIYGSINIGFYWMGELTEMKNYIYLAPIYSILIYGSTILISFIFFVGDKIFEKKKF